MAERYTKVFSLKENLYSAETPVLISAGALTKDNQTGKVFAQLRLQNIDRKFRNIVALKVAITSYDPAGNILESSKEHQYLDLNAGRGTEFGSKQAISLGNPSARSFDVAILEVVFSEGTPWTANKQEWVSLGKQKTLEKALGAELAEQYRRDTYADAKYEVFANHGVWMCSCGALNETGESQCCKCKNNKTKLFTALDHNTLASSLSDRKEKINIEAKKKSNNIKKATIAILCIALLIIGVLFISHITLEKKAQPVVDAFVGTEWSNAYGSVLITVYSDYMEWYWPNDRYGIDTSYRKWKVVGIDENVMEIAMDFNRDYEQRWEVLFDSSNGIYSIVGFRKWDESSSSWDSWEKVR